MKFFEKVSVVRKVGAVNRKRGMVLQEMLGSVHPLFTTAQMYVANFYMGIIADPNTRDLMRAMSKSDEESLDRINCMLVFWFFWVMERWQGHQLFVLPQVRLGLSRIWSIDDKLLDELIERFAAIPVEEQSLQVWKYVQWALNDTSLSPVFGLVHLGGAMTAACKQFDEYLGSMSKLQDSPTPTDLGA